MRMSALIALSGLVFGVVSALDASAASAVDSWPTWRGPNADGISPKGNPPVSWSESKNIKWKVELPGSGSSTPVVWGDKMFLTTSIPMGEPTEADPSEGNGSFSVAGAYAFDLVCLDRLTGKVLWQRTAAELVPHEGHHPDGSYSAYSPVTDGEFVWASFGSRGLYCYDFNGNFVWNADLVQMRACKGFGEGSSPALAGDKIVVLMDHEGQSKITAFNKKTGATVWEKDRDEVTTWTTPFVIEVDGGLQIVAPATGFSRAYDAETGDVIWQVTGMTVNTVPTPVTGFGHVYLASGYRGHALQAIKLGRTGDLSGSDAISWEVDKNTPYIASPLIYGDRIYFLADRAPYLSCFDARTGKPLYERQRAEEIREVYASLVGAAGKIYIAGRRGTVAVIKQGDAFEVLATNTLDDGFDASPVVIGDELYLKGNTYLYCIAEE